MAVWKHGFCEAARCAPGCPRAPTRRARGVPGPTHKSPRHMWSPGGKQARIRPVRRRAIATMARFLPRVAAYPVESLFEHRVTRHRAPSDFDEHVTDSTGALAANKAASHGGPRRIRAGRQPRVAEQRPLIGKAGHVAQFGREGPCGDLADARDAPIHLFDLLLLQLGPGPGAGGASRRAGPPQSAPLLS